jgi:hypothetical protein
MAVTLSEKCSHCKRTSIAQCDVCFNRFCSAHFREHRQHLDTRFDQMWHDRNTPTHQIIDHSSKLNQSQLKTLLSDVNQWEQQALKSVKQTADRLRNRINEMMVSKTGTGKIVLDQTSKELKKHKIEHNYFEQDIKQMSERLKEIQIDLDLHKSRIKMIIPPIKSNPLRQISLEHDIRRAKDYFSNGTLLCREHQFQLNEFYGTRNQMWQLAYKGTRHGFASTDFHRFCDKKGPTLTVIQSSSGYLFGGYTSANWVSHDNWQWLEDMDAFLFTLINPNGILPTKYQINTQGRNAIGCKTSMGPTFGLWDICVYSNNNENARSTSTFPSDYIDSTGKGRLTFTGSHYFKTAEIEVYILKHKLYLKYRVSFFKLSYRIKLGINFFQY